VIGTGCDPAPFPPALPDLDRRLGALPGTPGPKPGVWAACAAHLAARHALNQHFLGEIANGTGLPVVPLPLLPSGVRGPEDLARLERPLLAAEAP
jgi:hypothetical protein